MLLSAVAAIISRGALPFNPSAKDWLFALAGILFVIGVGRVASVTNRNPVGTVAGILFVIAPLTQAYWFTLGPDPAVDPHVAEDFTGAVMISYVGIVIVLAVITVGSIATVRAVPSPWQWAPLWVLLWTPATLLIGLTMFSSAELGTFTATFGANLFLWGPALGTAFLGVLGITLGLRRAPATVSAESSLQDLLRDDA